MPHPYYPSTPPVQQQPIQVQAPAETSLHLNRPHRAATHQQSNARGNGEDEDDDEGEDDDSFEAENNSHRSLRGGGSVVVNETDIDQEARRRSIAYASHMPSSYSLPFQSGQHDPRLVASQVNEGPSTSSPPPPPNAISTPPTSYMNGASPGASGNNVNDNSAVLTGTKRKRDSTGTGGSPSSPTSYPKMRLVNGTSKIKGKGTGGKAAVIEAFAAAEAVAAQAIMETSASVSRSQASGSGHGSAGEEGDDAEGGDDSPTNGNGGVIPDGGPQEINPDGTVTVHGMRLPPIMQVEKQHVTTTATQAASANRRRNEAQFSCPVPGCGSTFTRRFNLRGTSTLVYGYMTKRSILTTWIIVYRSSTLSHRGTTFPMRVARVREELRSKARL